MLCVGKMQSLCNVGGSVNYKSHSAEYVRLTSAFLNELSAICYVGMCTVIFAHFRVLFFPGRKVNV